MMLPNGWKKVKLGDILTAVDYGTAAKSDAIGKYPVLRMGNLENGYLVWDDLVYSSSEEEYAKYELKKGDILFNRTNSRDKVGKTSIYCGERPSIFAGYLIRLKVNNECDPYYVNYCMNSKRFAEFCKSVRTDAIGQSNINAQVLQTYDFSLPPIEEQRKIAATLSVWDSVIEKMEKLIDAKENHFNQLMNKLIVIDSSNSKWNTFALKNVFDVVNRKNKNGNTNVLTSSAQYGLVNQQEYYKKKIASSNTSGYYLLEKGDFAYNRSYSTGYPYGVVKRLDKYESGVLSTLYLCFSLKKEYQSYSDFFVFLFESGYLNNQLALICREGARNHGLLNVSKEDFFNMKVQLPNEKEQQSIVCILHNHSLELSLLKQQLENYKKQKQGLMQKLLTGEWRVK